MAGFFLAAAGSALDVYSQATISYFGDHLFKIKQTAQQALNAPSLETLQVYARKTMEQANAFQQAARSVNDEGFVSQAVDIYTYAQRATVSTSYDEAHQYMAQAESYVKFSADQADERPFYETSQESDYHDYSDVSYRNYYDHNYDVVFYEPER